MSQAFEVTSSDLLAELDGFRVEIDEATARADIILDRPPLNIVTMRQRDQMAAVFDALDRDARVRVIVMRAAGKHFSSGGDIRAFLDSTPETVSRLAVNVMAPERCRKPVIAALQGYCFGVGFEFSLACDFRIVTESTQLALPEQRIGMIPGSGGSARLVGMVGIARAKEIAMLSKRISGRRALDWGIALDCVPDGDLATRTDALVAELTAFAPLAQRTLKAVLNGAQDQPLHAAIETEGEAFGRLRSSQDFAEGVDSFYAKRKPNFVGA